MSSPAATPTRETFRPRKEQRDRDFRTAWKIPDGVVWTFVTDTENMRKNGQSLIPELREKGYTILSDPEYPDSARKVAFIKGKDFEQMRAEIQRIVDHVGGVKPRKLADARGQIDEVDDRRETVSHEQVVAAAQEAAIKGAASDEAGQ